MSWSLRVAQVFGIPIRVHVTFLLVVAWGALTWSSKGGATGALITVKAIHELQRIQGRYALVTMCIGGGQGIAAIFERV